ncbi:MAG: succinoglycan biosynthesis protein exop [Notoacmeibacter sp.]|nr:succinoglycan biosynthesis protein exop [Notoacmeibacter sp.]
MSPGAPGERRRPDDLQEAIDLLSERHRRARSRREAVENPYLNALSNAAAPVEIARRLADARLRREATGRPQSPPLLSRIAEPAMGRDVPGGRTMPGNEASERLAAPEWGKRGEGHLDDDYSFEQHAADDHFHVARGRDDDGWKPLIDPMAVVSGVLNSKKIIAAATMAGAMLGVFVALNTPKMYVSTAEILIDPRDLKIADRELTSGGLPSDATLAIVENQVRVMYSGPVLQKVVSDLKLASDPEFNGTGSGGLGSIFGALKSLVSRQGGPSDVGRKTALATENLAQALTIARGGKTFIVTVSAKTRDPDKSAKIANKVFTVFMDEAGKIQARTAGRAESELGSRLGELRAGVQKAEQDVENFKSANDLIDAQGRLISDDQIVKINDQLSVARARTIELNAKVRSVRGLDAASVSDSALPESVNSAVLSELRSQNARLRQEADSLANRLGPRHPKRQAVEAQIEGARRQIAAELQRIASSIQIELKRAIEQEQALAGRLAEAKARQANVSDKLVVLRELEREAAAQRAIYENYLLRTRDAGEQKSVNTANISLISEATPPLLSSGISRSMIAIASTVLGFLAGVGFGAMRGAMASFRARPDITSQTPVGRAMRAAPRRRVMRDGPVQPNQVSHGRGLPQPAAEEAPQPAYATVPVQASGQPAPQPVCAPSPYPPMPQSVWWQQPVMQPAVMAQPMWPPMMQPQPPVWPVQTVMPAMMMQATPLAPVVPAQAAADIPHRHDDAQDGAREANERELAELRDSLRSVREKVLGLNERRPRRNY